MRTVDSNHTSQGKRMPRDRVLIFVAASASMPDATMAEEAGRFGWRLIEVATPGDALRQLMFTQPVGVVVFIGSDSAIDASALLLACLRERRPRLPLVALAKTHSNAAERRLRAAGATAYVSGGLDFAASAAQLIAGALDGPVICEAQVNSPARSPPAIPNRCLPRIRGRPGAGFKRS